MWIRCALLSAKLMTTKHSGPSLHPLRGPSFLKSGRQLYTGFSTLYLIHAHTPGPSRMTLTVFGPSRSSQLRTPPDNSERPGQDTGSHSVAEDLLTLRLHVRRWAEEPMLSSAHLRHRHPAPPHPRREQGWAPPPRGGKAGVYRIPEPPRPLCGEIHGPGWRGGVGARQGVDLPGRLRGALRPLGRGGGCEAGERESQERLSQEKKSSARLPAAKPSKVPPL